MAIRSRENVMAAWAFLVGVILAVIVGMITTLFKGQTSVYLLGVLAALGVIIAYFVDEKDVQTFLLASVSLVLVSFAGIQGLVLSAAVGGINIGKMITQVLGALLFMFVPSAIIVALKTMFSIAKS